MNIKTILKGYRLGTSQVVGNLRMIPILTDTPFTKMSGMESIYLKKDVSYETLIMANNNDSIAVIPQGLMYVTSEKAQDRAIGSAHLIKGKGEKSVDVDCLQPSQCGYMSDKKEDREYGILPKSLRVIALEKAGDGQYDTLWKDIEKFLNVTGLKGQEIVKFFKEFKDELETFIAQYEPVDKQVGAIFIINNVLLGIEIMPTYEAWLKMWRPLVRDCYGSEAILFNKKGYSRVFFKPILKTSEVETFEDLEDKVNDLEQEEKSFVSEIISEYMDSELNGDETEIVGDFSMQTFKGGKFVGQAVQHGPEHFVYVSLMSGEITREEREQKARKFDSRWNENNPYNQNVNFEA